MNVLGARVRLVKGAFREPRAVAHQTKADTDAAVVDIMELLMTEGMQPAIATHGPAMIEATKGFAASRRIAADRFEFQMLFGIRPHEQERLARQGQKMRVYVPYGDEWYGYLVRRMAEKPANLSLFLRAVATKG
jgi:proline dehydrogenase